MIVSETAGLTKGSEQKISVKCDTCGVCSTTTYANYWNSQNRRGWPGTTYCRGCACRVSANARKGKPAHNKGKKLPTDKKGKNHPSWKGGRYLSHDGYWMVYIGADKSASGWKGYRKEHVIVAESVLGRSLLATEVVHHIDGDKQNNRPENLWVSDQGGHRTAHQSLQEIGYRLLREGFIVFCQQEGLYKLNEDQNVRRNEQPAGQNHQVPR